MSSSVESIVNNAFNQVVHLLSDVGTLKSVPAGSKEQRGFARFSKLFCDSIIFWGLYNHGNNKTKGTAIGKYIAELRDAFSHTELDVESVKLTHTGKLEAGHEYFSKHMLNRHKSAFDGKLYMPGFIAIKVSLDYSRAKVVVPVLANMLLHLHDKSIVLHDIDFAHDCKYVTTRYILQKRLRETKVGEVKDDVQKVGHHCISWKDPTEGAENIRYKVYNKFAQVMESAEVRKSLGSRMEDLVEKETTFARRVKRYKKHGYTRVELTFYGPHLSPLWKYQDEMDKTRKFLKSCPTFKCSFEAQWQERAKCITSMAAVYFPKKKLFAYCHWWNSVTSKKYGYMWKNVKSASIPLLLANYSFNDRPIYYMEGRLDKENKVVLSEIATYMREPGCTAITLVPGSQKGMYPSRDASPNGARKFCSVGIVEVDNISIAWPKRAHNKNSIPLAEIIECDDDNVDANVLHLKSIHVSMYTAGHQILEPDTDYTIVAAGYKEYRGIYRWHFITDCGLKIRAGKSLAKIWGKWRIKHLQGLQRIGSVKGVPFMNFHTVRVVRSRGEDDIKCEAA